MQRDYYKTEYGDRGMDRECSLAMPVGAGVAPTAPARITITDHVLQTTTMAAQIAVKAQSLAGKLVGHYPPKQDAAKQPAEVGDIASQLEIANSRVRSSLEDIVDALNAIEGRLA